jgi:deazaflavin-dependent oxidoreductase (nitroreductase family)
MWIKVLMAMNVFLYRLTRGAFGSRMAGQSVLLLPTIGRKSGKAFTIPLNYYRDGENYVVVASNWGKEYHPAWFYNLMQQGRTEIQVKDRKMHVQASQATGDDYDRLWKVVTGKNDYYIRYQKQTDRKIPLIILTPEG